MKHARGTLGSLIFYVGMALAFLLLTGLLTATYEQPVHAGALMQGEPSATITPTFTRTPAPTATSMPTSVLPADIVTLSPIGNQSHLALNLTEIPAVAINAPVNNVVLFVCDDNEDCDAPITQFTQAGKEPALAYDSSNRPHLTYVYSNRMRYIACTTSACNFLTTKDIETTGNIGYYSSIALNGNIAFISYYDMTNGNLKLARCTNVTTCSTPIVVDSLWDVGIDTSIRLTSAGIPVISYHDITNRDLKLAICNNSTTCNAPTIRIIASDGYVGEANDLALTDDDIPVISYNDSTNGHLKLVRCGSPTCDTWSTYTIDSDTSAGQNNSLELINGELPIISYQHIFTGDLRLAVCYTADCATVGKFVLDSLGHVGAFSSLELDSQKRIYISYYDLSNGRLKLYLGKYSFDVLPTLTPTFTPTDTPTPTYTHTPTFTDMPTDTPTATYTYTPTHTPTLTMTPTNSPTPSITPTADLTAAPARNFFTTQQPTLTWSRVTWATGYHIEIAADAAFTTTFTTSYTLPPDQLTYTLVNPLANGTYYYRVRAVRPDSSEGNWSSIESFTVSS